MFLFVEVKVGSTNSKIMTVESYFAYTVDVTKTEDLPKIYNASNRSLYDLGCHTKQHEKLTLLLTKKLNQETYNFLIYPHSGNIEQVTIKFYQKIHLHQQHLCLLQKFSDTVFRDILKLDKHAFLSRCLTFLKPYLPNLDGNEQILFYLAECLDGVAIRIKQANWLKMFQTIQFFHLKNKNLQPIGVVFTQFFVEFLTENFYSLQKILLPQNRFKYFPHFFIFNQIAILRKASRTSLLAGRTL